MHRLSLFPLALLALTSVLPCGTWSQGVDINNGIWHAIPCSILKSVEPYRKKKKNPSVRDASNNPDLIPGANITTLLTCPPDLAPQICSKARATLEASATHLASLLRLAAPLHINASFTHMCPTAQDCPDGTVAQANPTRLLPVQEADGSLTLVPQALLKQLHSKPIGSYADSDIAVTFNLDAQAWYPPPSSFFSPSSSSSPPQGPRSTETDFMWATTHELLHGLGLGITAWKEWFSDPSSPPSTPFYTPALLVNDSQGIPTLATSDTKPLRYQGHFSSTSYDKYFWDPNQGSWDTLAKRIDSFAPAGTQFTSTSAMLNAFQASKSSYASAVQVAKSSSSGQPLYFGLKPGDLSSSIRLETSARAGTSQLTHVDYTTFNPSPDFLLVYRSTPGVSLSAKVKQVGGKDPVGPHLLSMLQTLGYSLMSGEGTSLSTSITSDQSSSSSTMANRMVHGYDLSLLPPLLTFLVSLVMLYGVW
ncbi:MAG: hypothetical protein DHS80DRAFT_22764 [Piptocephalis tieghemiana]|nr:MAG: hypothetical protein DHS80DRAFT_22764 [Piptocephalis tieghemiana]